MHLLHQLSAWVQAYPELTLGGIFLICMVDCLFVIGLFVPGGISLFFMGALISLHVLEMGPTLLVATLGGITGDWISFELGKRYGDKLLKTAFFQKRPMLAERGAQFFQQHGSKGLILAHVIGLLRPIIPTTAGAYGLSRVKFFLGIIPAALTWSLVYVLPGVAFGTSLGMAAEVTWRLAIMIVTVVTLLGISLWFSRRAVLGVSRNAEHWLNGLVDWSHRHRRLGRFGAALADPEQPELPALFGLSLLLMMLGAICVATLLHNGLPLTFDQTVEETLRNLREPGGVRLAVAISLLGSPKVYVSFSIALLISLFIRREVRAAYHFVAVLVFGAFSAAALAAVLPSHAAGTHAPLGFNTDLVLVFGMYALVPGLLSAHASAGARIVLYSLVMLALLLLLLARLYLGGAWFSISMIEGIFGLIWAAAVGIAYRRHVQAPPLLRRLWPAGLIMVLALATSGDAYRTRLALAEPALETQTLNVNDWWHEAWRTLPARRLDMSGRDKQFLNLQWAGALPLIEQDLRGSGWLGVEPLSLPNTLRWLAPEGPIDGLPLLPRMHAGRYDQLALRMPIDNDHQYLLRLWHSGYVLKDGTPIWLGSVTVQRAGEFFRLLRYTLNENLYTAALIAMPPLPASVIKHDVLRAPGSFTTRLLRPASTRLDPETP